MVDSTVISRPFSIGGIPPREFARRIWKKIDENELFLHASAAAYYALTALVPFLGVLVALAAHLVPDLTGTTDAPLGVGGMTVEEFRKTLAALLPNEAYGVVADEIAYIQQQPPVGVLSVGMAVSVWLASSFFGTIITALNRIYGVKETRPYWRLLLRAIALTVMEAVIVIGSMFVLAIWPVLRKHVPWSTGMGLAGTILEWGIVSGTLFLSFSLTAWLGPNTRRCYKSGTAGSTIGTLALIGVGLLLRIYLEKFGTYDKTYGSLAGVMVLLFVFWVAAVVLLVAIQIDKIIEDEQEKKTCQPDKLPFR